MTCLFFWQELDSGKDQTVTRLFSKMRQYPVILTFNGDRFDLLYLYHRAKNLGFVDREIPFALGRDQVYIKNGIHIDLYRFFFNASIRIYAFSAKYRSASLDAIAQALLGQGKIGTQGIYACKGSTSYGGEKHRIRDQREKPLF